MEKSKVPPAASWMNLGIIPANNPSAPFKILKVPTMIA